MCCYSGVYNETMLERYQCEITHIPEWWEEEHLHTGFHDANGVEMKVGDTVQGQKAKGLVTWDVVSGKHFVVAKGEVFPIEVCTKRVVVVKKDVAGM